MIRSSAPALNARCMKPFELPVWSTTSGGRFASCRERLAMPSSVRSCSWLQAKTTRSASAAAFVSEAHR